MVVEPHILVVDDNPDVCELVQSVLEVAGFRVSITDDTARALQLVASEQFDVLLLDYWLQDLTGVELCRRIRAFDQSTPILLCSGVVTPAEKQAAVLAGAQGYIHKPFNSTDLIGALRSVLKTKTVDQNLA